MELNIFCTACLSARLCVSVYAHVFLSCTDDCITKHKETIAGSKKLGGQCALWFL